jgi:hypothetical protein
LSVSGISCVKLPRLIEELFERVMATVETQDGNDTAPPEKSGGVLFARPPQ